MFVQMKAHLLQLHTYQASSGRHWDDKIGANITSPSCEAAWEADTKQFPMVSIIPIVPYQQH